MATWIEDMSTWIASSGFGTEAVDLFVGGLPDPKDIGGSVMCLEPYPGRDGIYIFDSGGKLAQSFPRVQMYFRDVQDEFLAPFARAMSVYNWLVNQFGVVAGTSFFPGFKASEPFKLGGQDATGRYVITMRVEVTINH